MAQVSYFLVAGGILSFFFLTGWGGAWHLQALQAFRLGGLRPEAQGTP